MLVYEQTLIRRGRTNLLDLSDQVIEVGQAADGEQALVWLTNEINEVEIILLDLRMPKLDDNETLQALRGRGYLLKNVELETLVQGIAQVHGDESMIQPAITSSMLQGLQGLNSVVE